jgi:hypothetical protein
MTAVKQAVVIQRKPVTLKYSEICLLPSLACDSPYIMMYLQMYGAEDVTAFKGGS